MKITTPVAIRRHTAGFTLVELMLSMAFLAFLLLFIVVAMIQLIATYNKGLVYKEINQAGRTITEELTRNLRVAGAATINTQYSDYGRLCVGGQSYIWNAPDTQPRNRFTGNGEEIGGVIRVPDTAGRYCSGGTNPPAVDRAGMTIMAHSNVEIRHTVTHYGDNGRLTRIKILFSSSGVNAPPPGSDECQPGKLGEYCATAYFDITVANRN
ncbi:hypothetical protein JNJ66_06245 [Candidatus Saccharibacteria bacterium]|nr:hypothetical protein [Candidatus Saccharibacteria bacterium]